jgi:hypothetical protein
MAYSGEASLACGSQFLLGEPCACSTGERIAREAYLTLILYWCFAAHKVFMPCALRSLNRDATKESEQMTLGELKALRDSGQFHHATYRNFRTVWEGLYIYARQDNGFNGFVLVGCFGKDNADLNAAEDIIRDSGISVGSYGNG